MNETDVSFAINASDMSGHVLIVEGDAMNVIDRFAKTVCSFRLSDYVNASECNANVYPCTGCGTGWATVSIQGCKSCHDDCEKLKEYYRKKFYD